MFLYPHIFFYDFALEILQIKINDFDTLFRLG